MDNRTLEEVRKNETKLIEEIKSLEKQLEYLRSGEYYNQLRFENEMLQQVVDTNGVPSEVYDYIDCTHRNTELLEENQELNQKYLNAVADYEQEKFNVEELKKQLEEKNNSQIFIDTQDMEERYAEGLYQDYLEEENKKYKNQQKEFIDWLEENYKNTQDIWYIKILNKYKELGGK